MEQKTASKKVRYYRNPEGPVIGVTGKGVIRENGNYFKDINGDGILHPYKDWRNTPKERAQSLVKELSLEEKIGLLFINSLRMGIFRKEKEFVDATGLLDEKVVEADEDIFSDEKTYGTTYTIREMGIRHFILRENPSPRELTDWMNQLNEVAEGEKHAIPVVMASNSRNENGEAVFGMNDASGVFAAWPGTLGIAAAVRGTGLGLIDEFADCIRREWNAVGMKKGYMYMADTLTDPRWQRSYGTFGEDPELICRILERLIPGIQGSEQGATPEGVAMTIKHFPGGGARENGFDPHYAMGQWNVYQTEDSLQNYHLPGFFTAVRKKAASIMPYYAKPAGHKSRMQTDLNGEEIPMEPVGFAFNQFFLQELLRNQMKFEGYINSDSGITSNMAWGVEKLDTPERIALALYAGVDLISETMDVWSAKEAYERRTNGYYDQEGHAVPEGYTLEQVTLSDEVLDRAAAHTLEEMFALGLFENPYRNPGTAEQEVATKAHWDHAARVHRESVVLLKNADRLLPLTPEKLEGKKVYVEGFTAPGKGAEAYTEQLRQIFSGFQGLIQTGDYEEADYAILFVNPSSGEYFSATRGYLELDICEGKQVCDVDEEGRPAADTHEETTLEGTDRLIKIAEAVHRNGGKVISNINFTLAWLVGAVETCSDGLTAGFDTYPEATADVMMGAALPVGRMPVTLPKDDSVIQVDENGICISRNDIPGYRKDDFMPEDWKDENGKAYAYRDSQGNYYELDFGLGYE